MPYFFLFYRFRSVRGRLRGHFQTLRCYSGCENAQGIDLPHPNSLRYLQKLAIPIWSYCVFKRYLCVI